MDKFLLFALFLSVMGCKKSENQTDTVHFAGEIVNPTSEYVVLLKGRHVVDTAQLDSNNRFSFILDSIEGGLYNFKHEPEHQYVYLEKGDSLLLRLNTSDFDESLIFSGTNEVVNNFMLDLFLADEEVENNMNDNYYELDANEFSREIEKLRKDKLRHLDEVRAESYMSDKAYNIVKASINYTFYRFKEIYPFAHKRKLRETTIHEMPVGFYEYRKNIDYNNEELVYLRPYYNFMKSHFGNVSYMTCARACDSNGVSKKNQLHYNKHKLKVIDSLVKAKELRDNLFRNVAIDFLLKSHDSPQNNELFIREFSMVSANNAHQQEINNLYSAVQNISPNSPVPHVQLVNLSGSTVALSDLSKNKKTIFYFWSSSNKRHYENIFKRVAKLEEDNVPYDLVGINIKTDANEWKGILNTYNLDASKQFMASDSKDVTERLVVWPMNKCIVTNDLVIVDAFSNIYNNF
jgi:hypothetical protein